MGSGAMVTMHKASNHEHFNSLVLSQEMEQNSPFHSHKFNICIETEKMLIFRSCGIGVQSRYVICSTSSGQPGARYNIMYD